MREIILNVNIVSFSFNIFFLFASFYFLFKDFYIKGIKNFTVVLFISTLLNLLILLLIKNSTDIHYNYILQRHIYIFAFFDYLFWMLFVDEMFEIFSKKYKIINTLFIILYSVAIIFYGEYFFYTDKIIQYKGFINLHPRTMLNNILLGIISVFLIIIPFFKTLKNRTIAKNYKMKKVFLIFFIFSVISGTLDFLEIKTMLLFFFPIGLIIAFYFIGLTYFKEYGTLLKSDTENQIVMSELNKALKMESDILPRSLHTHNENCVINAKLIPSMSFSGDFYYSNFLDKNGEICMFYIGDVSGKGMSAAVITSIIHSLLRFGFEYMSEQRDYIDRINNYLIEIINKIFMVTLFIGIINFREKKLSYINAGHTSPILYNKEKNIAKFITDEKINAPIGIYKNYHYEFKEFYLSEGDSLFFYTDGMVEINKGKIELSERELLNIITDNIKLKDDEFFNAILNSAKIKSSKNMLFDDITLLNIDIL